MDPVRGQPVKIPLVAGLAEATAAAAALRPLLPGDVVVIGGHRS
ncbi:hypothetical protein [Lentzea guizhouensis]|nr:hypothetical protein [Lentzea guizhouensis]